MTKPAETDLKATVAKVKDLMKQEAGFLRLAEKNRLEAMMVAYDIGYLIEAEVIGKYGDKRLPEFAKLCGFTTKTAYNYLYLFRAVGIKPVLSEHADLPRSYWYALGASIRWQEDMLGDMIRRTLLQYPVCKDVDDSQSPDEDDPEGRLVMDRDKMRDIGRHLNDLRRELRQDGILYAFEEYELYVGKPPFGDKAYKKFITTKPMPHYANKEPHVYRGPVTFMGHRMRDGDELVDIYYALSVNRGDESKFEDAIVKVAQKLDMICRSTGAPGQVGIDLGEQTEELLAPHRLREETYAKGYRAVKWASQKKNEVQKVLAETVETKSVPVQSKLISGKSQDVLKTDAFCKRMIDVVITDPPYGEEVYDEWRPLTRVEHDESKTTQECAELVGAVARILVNRELIKHKFIWLSFCPIDWVHVFIAPILKAFKDLEYKHQILVWDKVSAGKAGGYRTFARRAEAIIYFNIGDRPLHTVTIDGKRVEMHPSIFTCRAESKAGKNEFWKPVELLKHLIRVTTGEQDSTEANRQVVLDPFAGSGSTGVACIECNRDFRLIESHAGQHKSALDNLVLASNRR